MPPGTSGDDQRGRPEDVLDVAPEAVPTLRNAFANALSRIDEELRLADIGLRVEPWAKDPVSTDTAAGINAMAADTEKAALEALRNFRRQLDTAVHNLDRITEQYRLLEDDNQATVTHKVDQHGQG